jgi:hypothetical protein
MTIKIVDNHYKTVRSGIFFIQNAPIASLDQPVSVRRFNLQLRVLPGPGVPYHNRMEQ